MSLNLRTARSNNPELAEDSSRRPYGPVPVAEAIFDSIQVSEVSVDVVTPKQFAAWIRGPVNSLIPHRSFRIWIQSAVGGEWSTEACEASASDLLTARQLSVPELRMLGQVCELWAREGYAPIVIEPDSALARSILSLPEGAGLVHGVNNLFGARCVMMFVDDAPDRLRSAMPYAELLAFYILLAARRVRASSAVSRSVVVNEPALNTWRKLTARELCILECVREGKSNQEIGLDLHISEFTVKSHLQRIFRKLGVSNRTQAVATAFALRALKSST